MTFGELISSLLQAGKWISLSFQDVALECSDVFQVLTCKLNWIYCTPKSVLKEICRQFCCSVSGRDNYVTSRKCYKPMARHWVYSTANMLRDWIQGIHVQNCVYLLFIYVWIDSRARPRPSDPRAKPDGRRMASESLLHNRTDAVCDWNQETSWLFQMFWIMDNIFLNYKESIVSKLYVGSTVEIFAPIVESWDERGFHLCFGSICKQSYDQSF